MDLVTKVLTVLFGYVTLFYGVRGFHNDPKCGQNYSRSPRILGGMGLKEGDFPWFVSIKENMNVVCSGFVINRKVILTAAHCFKYFSKRAANSPKTISVTLAPHHLNNSKMANWEQEVKVQRITRHPQYDPFNRSGKFDIALLLLENKIRWNQATKPVCLPTSNKPSRISYKLYKNKAGDAEFRDGETGIVVGWPTHEAAVEESREGVLQKVKLTLHSRDECSRILKERNVTIKTDIDSTVICAGSNNTGYDTCSGDSGSALLVKRGKVWVAIGIVSAGFGKCGTGRPALYTRISSYLDWIDLHNDEINSSAVATTGGSL